MKGYLLPKFEKQFNVKFLNKFKINSPILNLRKKIGMGENLVILLGSSGVGRDTILETCLAIVKKAERIRRTTTRVARKNLLEDKRLIFVNKNTFLRDLKNGRLIFGGYYRANNELYGISRKELLKLKNKNKIYFFECTINALPLKKLLPKAKLILLLPPSIESLKQHFINRGDRDWQKRYKVSCSEIKTVLKNIREVFKTGFIDLAFLNFNSKKTAKEIIKAIKNKKFAQKLWKRFLKQIKKFFI